MMEDCIFCKIIAGQIPSTTVFEDERVQVIEDINPQAPIHLLVLPKEHIDGIDTAQASDEALLGHMMLVGAMVARQKGIEQDGYRLVVNTGTHGAQSILHLHLHVLGGRQLTGQMG